MVGGGVKRVCIHKQTKRGIEIERGGGRTEVFSLIALHNHQYHQLDYDVL